MVDFESKKNKKRKIFVNFVIVLKSFQAMKNLLRIETISTHEESAKQPRGTVKSPRQQELLLITLDLDHFLFLWRSWRSHSLLCRCLLKPLAPLGVTHVVRFLGMLASLGVVAEQRQRKTTTHDVVDSALRVLQQETDPVQPHLQAFLALVNQLASHGVLVVHLGASPAALVDGDCLVEDVVRCGLKFEFVENLLLGEAVAMSRRIAIGDLLCAYHRVVNTADPVVAAEALHTKDVVGFGLCLHTGMSSVCFGLGGGAEARAC